MKCLTAQQSEKNNSLSKKCICILFVINLYYICKNILTMATSIMQIRIDTNLKKEATELFEDLGLDLPTAIRIFLKKAVKVKGIPFDIRERAATNEAINAMLSLNENAHRNGTVRLSQSEIQKEIESAQGGE